MCGQWRLRRLGSLAAIATAASVGACPLGPPAQAEVPPVGYVNAVKMTNAHVPIVANGRMQLHSTVLGKIECVSTASAEAWNAHENNEATKPERAYGEVLGWGSSSCTYPESIIEIPCEICRKEHIPLPITVTVSSEMPAEKTFRQGEICIEETKTLSQCPLASERETKAIITSYHRRVSSLPWKVELIRGERELELGILAKIGLAEYGESGTAEAQSTKCYPKEGTNPASFERVPPGCIAVDVIFPQVPYEFAYYGTEEIWAVNGAGNGLDASHLEWVAPAGKFFSSKGAEGEASTEGKLKVSGAEAVQLVTAK
jgi:hypothetical protein